MARPKALTRSVQPTREQREIAALAASNGAGEAIGATGLRRIQAILTPAAADALDAMVFGQRKTGFRVSASAVVESALLELAAKEPAAIAATIRQHIGASAARRKPLKTA
jgi:hypothetical protein